MRGIVLCCVYCFFASNAAGDDPRAAKWIWDRRAKDVGRQVHFEKSFSIAGTVARASLKTATVHADCQIEIDGKSIVTLEAYDPLQTRDVTEHCSEGQHRLTVNCRGVAGPSAFFLVLKLVLVDGSTKTIVTDATWKTGGGVLAFDDVSRKLLIPEACRVRISALENYEQWKQALGDFDVAEPAKFRIADGFQIELVRAARENEDSWVSFAFDPEGRIIIAKEQVGLLRMTLSEDGGSVIRTERIDNTLKECRGLVFRDGDLFANANDSKALFRVRQKNGAFTEAIELLKTPGGSGHGRNDLRLGPDAMLYSIHGDSVDLPAEADDFTSPFREARRGTKTNEGHLVRLDPATGDAELLVAGLRNPFGIDFNVDGEAFTYDADAEYDMGSPWYRPTRVNHLVIGADYGWRGVTKSWPPYFCDRADNARPNLDIGKGSPTAVRFGTRSDFPQRYREALFVLDWAYGRVLAVNMIPRGSSYLMAAETFLQGRPLNVTDIEFSPDGSMYLITGGRKTRSAIYRVRYTRGSSDAVREVNRFREELHRFASRSRARRRRLERMLVEPPSRERLPRILVNLEDDDPWIRYAAANVMERYPIDWWADSVLQGDSTRGLLSLARAGGTDFVESALRRLNEMSVRELSRSQLLELLQSYQLLLESYDPAQPARMASTLKRLQVLYPSGHETANRLLGELLIKLSDPGATRTTMNLLRAAEDPTERLSYLYALRNTSIGWTLPDRRAYFKSLGDAGSSLGGAGMPEFLSKIRQEAIATLSSDEQTALATLLAPHARYETSPPPPRKFVREWTVDELLSAFDQKRRPNLARGKEMFVAASCDRCHRLGDQGNLIGPDLTAASGRYTRRDLLTAIVQPSLVVAEKYRSLSVLTADGRVYVGQIAVGGDYRSPKLRLAVNASQPLEVIEIDKTEIQSRQFSSVSWMPADLLNTLSAVEVQDLVAYIESGGPTDEPLSR